MSINDAETDEIMDWARVYLPVEMAKLDELQREKTKLIGRILIGYEVYRAIVAPDQEVPTFQFAYLLGSFSDAPAVRWKHLKRDQLAAAAEHATHNQQLFASLVREIVPSMAPDETLGDLWCRRPELRT